MSPQKLLAALAFSLCRSASGRSAEEYVNILGGTDSKYDFSHGNSLPLMGLPWSADTWAVQSNLNDVDGWWFHPKDRRFLGIRNTRQPSPWINDYGQFLLTASMPGDPAQAAENPFWSGYNPASSVWSPYYFKTILLAYGTDKGQTTLEFSPSRHGGVMRVSFPPVSSGYENSGFDQSRRIAIILNGGNDTSSVKKIDGTTFITGVSVKNSGGVDSLKHYFAAAIYFGAKGNDNSVPTADSHADNNWAWVSVPPSAGSNVITVRVGTSFISEEQALLNLRREVGPSQAFEAVTEQARDAWRKQLSKLNLVDVGAGYSEQQQEDLRTVFYSTQYRASLFPRQLTETNEAGEVVHWSPYRPEGGVFPGPLSADSGFWDAYSTVYPFHSLVNRKELGEEMLSGWLNAFKEGGWLPKWSSPGYRKGMVGTMGDVTLADAIVKEVPGFDVDVAYEAIRKDAFEAPPEGVEGVGRVCLQGYVEYGAIPSNGPMTTGGNCYETVSRTLNYLQSDWAIAQAARKLGKTDDADALAQRSANFSLLFNSKTGFFQSKRADEKEGFVFGPTFDQYAWGGDYTEGGPWQYKFYVPYDPSGLAALYKESGRDICEELRRTQTTTSAYHIGAYSEEIHEQTEMPENCWGQYEHNNQPVHHMLYMFAAVDPQSSITGACAASGQMYLRRALTQLYKPGTDMFPGDEDNGQMSAWFLLSSMGLYSLSPGSTDYRIGSPLFSRVEITLGGGSESKKLIIEANNNGPNNMFVHAVRWNGVALKQNLVPYASLMAGGTLSFDMADKPL